MKLETELEKLGFTTYPDNEGKWYTHISPTGNTGRYYVDSEISLEGLTYYGFSDQVDGTVYLTQSLNDFIEFLKNLNYEYQ